MTASLLGTTIGSIRIDALLGSGGMGEVYRGFDTKLERRVAVKTIRSASRLDGEMRARFLREARILSKLEHPAICQVYDLIESPEADYLIFEFVEGQTLTARLARGPLPEAEALAIAEKLALGLAVAHDERIVHRDLKPDNVMITPTGAVKILDFGISRAARERSGLAEPKARRSAPPVPSAWPETAATAPTVLLPSEPADTATFDAELTRLGSVVGTIRYMSPEQASGQEVAEPSDLYSLGILLQELLTGRSPYPDDLRPVELLATVARGDSRPFAATDGDLERLVADLKRQNPDYRPTARETAERLRYVLQRPERLRRQRLRRWAAMLAFAGLMSVLLVVSVLAVRASRAADRAEREAARANEEARRASAAALRANREGETTRQVADFLVGLFEQASPDSNAGREVTAREIVDRGVAQVDLELGSQPLIQAKLQDTLGTIYHRMGRFDEAERLLQRALETRGEQSEEPLALARTRAHLGVLYADRGRWDEADSLLGQAVTVFQELAPNSAELAQLLNDRATVAFDTGRFDEARSLYEATLATQKSAGIAGSLEEASTLNNLGILTWQLGDYPTAQQLLERSLAIKRERLTAQHPELAALANNLGILLREQGRYAEAEDWHRQALAIADGSLGENHPETASVRLSLARLLVLRGRLGEAETLVERALASLEKGLGDDRSPFGRALLLSADLQRRRGRFELAERQLRQATPLLTAAFGEDHPLTVESLHVAARLAADRGRGQEAQRLYTLALDRAVTVLGVDHPDVEQIRKEAARLAG